MRAKRTANIQALWFTLQIKRKLFGFFCILSGNFSSCDCFSEGLTSRKRVQKYGLSASHATIATTFFQENTKKTAITGDTPFIYKCNDDRTEEKQWIPGRGRLRKRLPPTGKSGWGKRKKLLQLSEKSYRSFCNSSGKGQPGGAYPYLLRPSRGQALMIFRRSFFRK